jgi:hypothetical protein
MRCRSGAGLGWGIRLGLNSICPEPTALRRLRLRGCLRSPRDAEQTTPAAIVRIVGQEDPGSARPSIGETALACDRRCSTARRRGKDRREGNNRHQRRCGTGTSKTWRRVVDDAHPRLRGRFSHRRQGLRGGARRRWWAERDRHGNRSLRRTRIDIRKESIGWRVQCPNRRRRPGCGDCRTGSVSALVARSMSHLFKAPNHDR